MSILASNGSSRYCPLCRAPKSRISGSSPTFCQECQVVRSFSSMQNSHWHHRNRIGANRFLLQPPNNSSPSSIITLVPSRGLGFVPTLIRSVLKIRYLLLGGALGGGYSLAKQYDEWKKNLPDSDWIKDLFPKVELDKFRSDLIKTADKIKGRANEMDIGKH
jgi:hypothetical protein